MPLQHALRSELVETWVIGARRRQHNQNLDLAGLRKAFNDAKLRVDGGADKRGLLSLHREVQLDVDRLRLRLESLEPSERRYLGMLEYWCRELSKLL